jgi:hypothetical protein
MDDEGRKEGRLRKAGQVEERRRRKNGDGRKEGLRKAGQVEEGRRRKDGEGRKGTTKDG